MITEDDKIRLYGVADNPPMFGNVGDFAIILNAVAEERRWSEARNHELFEIGNMEGLA